jgi:hypothetical protein
MKSDTKKLKECYYKFFICFLTFVALFSLWRKQLLTQCLFRKQLQTANFIQPFPHKLNQSLYVSLTTIKNRTQNLVSTLNSIINGEVIPDHIFLFISVEKYLLDEGFSSLNSTFESCPNLRNLLDHCPLISINVTENIGPHRKLLPLLKEKWNEDCVIVTIDDDRVYHPGFIKELIKSYEASNRESVVAGNARKIGVCSDNSSTTHTIPYSRANGALLWPTAEVNINEMLLLPIGVGGVLYRPRFFHPAVFDPKLRDLTKFTDDLMFRLCSMMMNVSVVTACVPALSDAHPIICEPISISDLEIKLEKNRGKYIRSNSISDSNTYISMKNRRLLTSETSKSLFRQFNRAHGGNSRAFKDAVNYLRSSYSFDFVKFVNQYEYLERFWCLSYFSNEEKISKISLNSSSFYDFEWISQYQFESFLVFIQNWFDSNFFF